MRGRDRGFVLCGEKLVASMDELLQPDAWPLVRDIAKVNADAVMIWGEPPVSGDISFVDQIASLPRFGGKISVTDQHLGGVGTMSSRDLFAWRVLTRHRRLLKYYEARVP